MRGLAADLGLPLPAAPDLPATTTALAVIAGVGLIAWLAGRFAGARLANAWERKAGSRGEAIQAGSAR